MTSRASQNIAVAGGTGTSGKHVVEELLKADFNVVALIRKENPEFVKNMASLGSFHAEVVDLNSSEEISIALKKHKVDTVISTYFLWPDDWKTEVALVEGAEAAGVRRFAPTCFAMPNDKIEGVEIYSSKARTEERLLQTKMEFTNFACGIFMNYLAVGSPINRGGPDSPLGYLRETKFILDVENGSGKIPGTGDEPVVFTEIRDVGRGVALACAYDGKWVRETGFMVGDLTSYNEVVRIIEQETGRKMEITYLSRDEIDRNVANASSELEKFYFQTGIALIEGRLEYPNKLADIKLENPPRSWNPVNTREFIKKFWPHV